MRVEEQVVVIFAGTNGYLDDLPVSDVKRFENDLLDYFRGRHPEILEEIRSSGALPASVETAVKAFKNEFQPTTPAGTATPGAEAQGDADLEQAGGRAEAILPEVEIHRDEEEG